MIPVHEISSKDGSNIDELVESIGGVIARSSVSRGSVSSKRDALKATPAPTMVQQRERPPPSISAAAPVSSMSAQPHDVRAAMECAGAVSVLEQQQDELQLAIEEQQGVVAEAKAAAAEVAGRVEELESAFGALQQNFEGVLQKIMTQQKQNTEALAALQQSAAAHEQRAADEASARAQASQARDEQALSSVGVELAELNAVVLRVREEVKCATETTRQTEGRLKAVEEAVKAQEQGDGSNGAGAPPPVCGGDSASASTDHTAGATDAAAIIAEVEERVDARVADAQHTQAALLQKAEARLKDELAEGFSGYESRLGAVEEELAECHLESAGHVAEARNVAKKCAAEGVAKAVEQAAQLLNEEVRRLEAEWESRMADLATDFETAAMLGGGGSQGEAEAEERVNQLSKELSAAKASLAVNKTELELQQGEIAVLTNRADSAEEENAELRARVDKLQSTLLGMGDSPFASPGSVHDGGGTVHAASPARAGTGVGANMDRGSAADMSLRFDQSAMHRTTTDEIEADLMGTVNFNASYGEMSPMVRGYAGPDLSSSGFVLDSASGMPDFAPPVAQQQRIEERPWPSQRRASRDLGQPGGAGAPALVAVDGSVENAGADGLNQSSPPRRPRTAPPGWHAELERMLTEEKNESIAALDMFVQNSQRRSLSLSFRSSKRRQVTPSDGTLRGYIRHCYDGCDDQAVRETALRRDSGRSVAVSLSLSALPHVCARAFDALRMLYGVGQEMEQMREELRRMVEMFAAAGKIATTDWMTLPPPC